jgi:hypothetical protein
MVSLSPLLSACKQEQQASAALATEDKRPIMRIAFVGNEYTQDNNMINIIQLLAQNDPTSHFQVQVNAITMLDASLATLWGNANKKEILKPESWDYIVLQPHSMWAATEGHVYLTQKSISVWSRFASNIQAQPVLFMTWPLERNNSTYTAIEHATTLKNYKHMHRLIHGYSKAISKKEAMLLVPIGDYWMQAMALAPSINLYNENGSSPSLEGSYLTALIIYKTLVNGSLDDITYFPEGMSEETKDLLISIASIKITE